MACNAEKCHSEHDKFGEHRQLHIQNVCLVLVRAFSFAVAAILMAIISFLINVDVTIRNVYANDRRSVIECIITAEW